MDIKELLEKANGANSPEELAAIAKENGAELSRQEAVEWFDMLQKSGEIDDDELESISGGKVYPQFLKRYYASTSSVTSIVGTCDHWECKICGKKGLFVNGKHVCTNKEKIDKRCQTCKSFSPLGGAYGQCTNPQSGI